MLNTLIQLLLLLVNILTDNNKKNIVLWTNHCCNPCSTAQPTYYLHAFIFFISFQEFVLFPQLWIISMLPITNYMINTCNNYYFKNTKIAQFICHLTDDDKLIISITKNLSTLDWGPSHSTYVVLCNTTYFTTRYYKTYLKKIQWLFLGICDTDFGGLFCGSNFE